MNIMNNMNPRIRMKKYSHTNDCRKDYPGDTPRHGKINKAFYLKKKKIYIYKQIQNSMYSIILMLKRDTN